MRKLFRLSIDKSLLLILACMLGSGQVYAAPSPYATVMIINGKVITADSDDPDQISVHQAIAIQNDTIMAVGSNADIQKYKADWTEVIDAKGNTVLPGLIDTHSHLYETVNSFPWVLDNIPELIPVSLSASTSDELLKVLNNVLPARTRQVPEGQWIQVQMGPPASAVPLLGTAVTKQLLDKLSPTNPVVAYTRGGSVYNSLAIKSLSDRYRTEIPDDYFIDVEKAFSGDQTDGTRCARLDIITPAAGRINEYTQGYLELMQLNAQNGVTTHNTHIQCEEGFNASVHLDRNNLMPIRFGWSHRWMQPFNSDIVKTYWRIGDLAGSGSKYMFSLGSSAGALDNGGVGWCTSLPAKTDELKARERCPTMDSSPPNVRRLQHLQTLAELAALGRQTSITGWHVSGDGALDAYFETLMNAGLSLEQLKALRLQVDHCHTVRPDQIEMAARLNMAFSCDATRVPSEVLEEAYGEEYLVFNAPVASMLKAGVRAVISEFGSQGEIRESPFEDGVQWLTRTIDGKPFGIPEEAVPDRLTLLLMMTRWGAVSTWKEDKLGSIEPGKWADIIILNGDYMDIEIRELDTLKPIMTMVGGEVVFEDRALRNNMLYFDPHKAEWLISENTPTSIWRWKDGAPKIPARQ